MPTEHLLTIFNHLSRSVGHGPVFGTHEIMDLIANSGNYPVHSPSDTVSHRSGSTAVRTSNLVLQPNFHGLAVLYAQIIDKRACCY
jgi:hypothetical protein